METITVAEARRRGLLEATSLPGARVEDTYGDEAEEDT